MLLLIHENISKGDWLSRFHRNALTALPPCGCRSAGKKRPVDKIDHPFYDMRTAESSRMIVVNLSVRLTPGGADHSGP